MDLIKNTLSVTGDRNEVALCTVVARFESRQERFVDSLANCLTGGNWPRLQSISELHDQQWVDHWSVNRVERQSEFGEIFRWRSSIVPSKAADGHL